MKATITKTKSAEPMGAYKPTAVDARKAAADILVTACGSKYSISSKIALPPARGIVSHGNGNYSVTEGALAKLRLSYNVENDF